MTMGMLLLGLAGAAVSGAALTQADIFPSVIAKADATFRDSGFKPAGWQHRATLRPKGSETVKVRLAGPGPIQLIGMCDGACSNLDLDLLDAAGRSLDQDSQPDDFPIVGAEKGGSYSLRVSMRACDKPACAYVLRAYVRS